MYMEAKKEGLNDTEIWKMIIKYPLCPSFSANAFNQKRGGDSIGLCSITGRHQGGIRRAKTILGKYI